MKRRSLLKGLAAAGGLPVANLAMGENWLRVGQRIWSA